MSVDASPTLWIGTPQRGRTPEDALDPYTSKIGGPAACFRVGSTATERLGAAALGKYFQCPQCKSTSHVSLVSQVYAPVSVYDRVVYVLTCAACTRRSAAGPAASGSVPPAPVLPPGAGKKSSLAAAAAAKSLTSFCFAVRSQNFSREYFLEVQQAQRKATQQCEDARREKEAKETPLFAEADDDWGDDDDATQTPLFASASPAPPQGGGAVNSAAAEVRQSAGSEEQVSYPLAARATLAPVKGVLYTDGVPLDLYVEPTRAKAKELSIEEQLAVAERLYGDNAMVDTSGFEEDDETPAEACVQEYMEEMEATPSQCVRWCLGGSPLRTSLSAIGVNGASVPPPCAACGAPRQFEMQLTAPTVYFLTKDIGEAQNTSLHFSNVLVYTCSENCYGSSGCPPYLPEYVVVEDEL